MSECIHGLERSACDICSPRQTPEPTRRPSAPRTARTLASRSAPSVNPTSVRSADARCYLVVHRDRLGELLAAGPLGDEAGWKPELGEAGAFDPFRWPDAQEAGRGSELVVLVSTVADPDALQLVAVANEPARKAVAATLDAAGRRVRLALNPAWFA